MNLLRLVITWSAVSVPVSVVAGAFLAAGDAAGARRAATVRTDR